MREGTASLWRHPPRPVRLPRMLCGNESPHESKSKCVSGSGDAKTIGRERDRRTEVVFDTVVNNP